MFRNRDLFIATKHKKEEVIQPVFETNFGMNCVVPENFDSDALGTFSGEIERTLSPLDAARKKCRLVANSCNADLVLSSEGSFGPHPVSSFVPLNEEVLLFMDLTNGLEIKVVERTLKTNYASEEVTNVNDLLSFAEKIHFPSHGLILSGKIRGKDKYFKGITSHKTLIDCYQALKKRTDKIEVETDMRAMFNPTRMEVIKSCAVKLAEKIKSCCPNCLTPGFGPERSVPGLICSQCEMPTKSIQAHVYQCQHCLYEEQLLFPNNKKTEDPMYCDFCNP